MEGFAISKGKVGGMIEEKPDIHPFTLFTNGYSFVVGLTLATLPDYLQINFLMFVACILAAILNFVAAYAERQYKATFYCMIGLGAFWVLNLILQAYRLFVT